ncbi:FtsQ-type POTRA domain-containing protein [Acetobacteraceae bacterium H6797]|nr:FtsQ-type POTRA domain-containing protein [Acetobacteraceae bacterium H6797]
MEAAPPPAPRAPREARGRAAQRLANSRAKEPERPSPVRLWLRRRRKLLRPMGIGIASIAGIAVVAAGIYALDPTSRLRFIVENFAVFARDNAGFAVQEVEVVGRKNTPKELLYSALGVSRGDPILSFSPEAAKERLETISWVEKASIERHLPDRIVIHLTERAPFAIWQNNNRFAIIDREGREVVADRLDAFGPLPLVVGAGANTTAAGLIEQLHDAPDLLARTQALVRISERRWNLRLYNGADVLLPEGHEEAAIRRLAELQQRDALLDRPLAAIDLRLPDKLVLRPIPTAAPAEQTPQRRGSGRG